MSKNHVWQDTEEGTFCVDCGIRDTLSDPGAVVMCQCSPTEDSVPSKECNMCLGTGWVLNGDVFDPECTPRNRDID